MSTLLDKCNELRTLAAMLVVRDLPEVASLVREAADIIWQLRDDLQQAQADNAKLREQMERLVTLLRNDCDIDASWDGLRGFWLIGLTKNGCLMRDRACKAEAENAKLREENARLRSCLSDDADNARQIMGDNAKLRELVKSMYYDLTHMTFPPDWVTDYEADMRELGVEVDG